VKGRTRARRNAGLLRQALCVRLMLLIFPPPKFRYTSKRHHPGDTLALSPVVLTQSMRRIWARANGGPKSKAEFLSCGRRMREHPGGFSRDMGAIKNTYFYVLTPAGKRPIIPGGVRHWWRIVLLVPPQVPFKKRAPSSSRAHYARDGTSGRSGRRRCFGGWLS
jgi:hypothetical protein